MMEKDRDSAGQHRPHFSITTRRPVAILMVVMAVCVFGWVSYQRLSLDLMPTITYPTLTVRTEFPGTAPEEIETLISRPLEQELGIVRRLVSISSISKASLSDVVLEFDWDTDMNAASQNIRERVDRVWVPPDAQLSKEVERRLQSIPGLLGVHTDIDMLNPELLVRLDRNQIRRYGLEPERVSGNIAYLLGGAALSEFQTEDGRMVDMRVLLKEGDRQSMNQLRDLSFSTAEGKRVPLEALATLHVRPNVGEIRRENRQTMLAVEATATQEDAAELFEQVDKAMQGFEMPRGYRWDKGARYERMEEEDQSQRFAIIIAVTFVFLLMGLLFESFVLPLSVIVAIPFAFLGVYWTLYLTGTTYEILARIGTVILIGIVVNNAIVLIDLTNRLRRDGMSRREALVEAAWHRFRPILMTTFTTTFCLIPWPWAMPR